MQAGKGHHVHGQLAQVCVQLARKELVTLLMRSL